MIRLVPRLFARLEKCSLECIIPLDINEFLFVRYMFNSAAKLHIFHEKRAECAIFFIIHPNEWNMILTV